MIITKLNNISQDTKQNINYLYSHHPKLKVLYFIISNTYINLLY